MKNGFDGINAALQEGRCYYCGGAVEPRIEDSCCGTYCPKCAMFLVVTTYIPPVREDRTRYRIHLHHADAHNPQHIRTLARLIGCNYPQTRAFIAEPCPLIAENLAPEILAIRQRLDAVAIAYRITPPFPYNNTDDAPS